MSKKLVESPARRQVRVALRNIALSIKDLGIDEFDREQLKRFNIRVDSIPLDETACHYFAPFPGHLLPHPDENEGRSPYRGIDGEREGHPFTRPVDRAYKVNIHLSSYIAYCGSCIGGEMAPWTSKLCVDDYGFTGLYKDEQPEYGCYYITDMDGPTYPHFRKAQFIDQMVSPVLIISLMGLKARVIEAYSEGHTLVVRPTKMFDFTHGNPAAFKTLAQWWLGDPIGNTRQAS